MRRQNYPHGKIDQPDDQRQIQYPTRCFFRQFRLYFQPLAHKIDHLSNRALNNILQPDPDADHQGIKGQNDQPATGQKEGSLFFKKFHRCEKVEQDDDKKTQ